MEGVHKLTRVTVGYEMKRNETEVYGHIVNQALASSPCEPGYRLVYTVIQLCKLQPCGKGTVYTANKKVAACSIVILSANNILISIVKVRYDMISTQYR